MLVDIVCSWYSGMFYSHQLNLLIFIWINMLNESNRRRREYFPNRLRSTDVQSTALREIEFGVAKLKYRRYLSPINNIATECNSQPTTNSDESENY